MTKLGVKSSTKTKQASKDKRVSVSRQEDRLRTFANFIIDRVIEEQNKAKLAGNY